MCTISHRKKRNWTKSHKRYINVHKHKYTSTTCEKHANRLEVHWKRQNPRVIHRRNVATNLFLEGEPWVFGLKDFLYLETDGRIRSYTDVVNNIGKPLETDGEKNAEPPVYNRSLTRPGSVDERHSDRTMGRSMGTGFSKFHKVLKIHGRI